MPRRLIFVASLALGALVAQPQARATRPRSPMTVVTIRSDPSPSPPPKDVSTPTSARSQKPSARPRKLPAKPARVLPAVELIALNSHESFSLRPTAAGGFARTTMRALARFLRCHHTQRLHAISERLAHLLYETANHFDARLEIVAGYRAPKIARKKGNSKSPHKLGVACDFRVPGVSNEVVRDYVRSFPRVGVGFYPNSGFVHLDVRDKQSAFWVDYSAPGQRAMYSKTPEDDVRRLAEPPDTEPEGPDPQVGEGPGALPPSLPALVPVTPQEN